MDDKYNSINEMSLERIYRKRSLKTIYFKDYTPDEVIEKINEIKSIAVEKGYENLRIGFSPPELECDEDMNYFSSISSYAYSLETDEEYKARLTVHYRILEKNKKSWEDRSAFYKGIGKGSYTDLADKYTQAINNIK